MVKPNSPCGESTNSILRSPSSLSIIIHSFSSSFFQVPFFKFLFSRNKRFSQNQAGFNGSGLLARPFVETRFFNVKKMRLALKSVQKLENVHKIAVNAQADRKTVRKIRLLDPLGSEVGYLQFQIRGDRFDLGEE